MLSNIKSGKIYGIGINDADYCVTRHKTTGGIKRIVWRCPYYLRWTDMLERCYSVALLERLLNYDGCSVCDDWVYFSKFKAWMEKQEWEGKHLDKDLLIQGNKIYSPETCVFISQSLNKLFTDRCASRGEYPLGVSRQSNTRKFRSGVTVNGRRLYLGLFETPELAHKAWQIAKRVNIISEIGKHNNSKIDSALQVRVEQLDYELANNLVTIKL